jgi:hypothetical protein
VAELGHRRRHTLARLREGAELGAGAQRVEVLALCRTRCGAERVAQRVVGRGGVKRAARNSSSGRGDRLATARATVSIVVFASSTSVC